MIHLSRGEQLRRLAPIALGLSAGIVVLGPGMRPGALLNLDLVMFDEARVPSGIWGLGPDLPQRVPLFALVGWLGAVVGGTVANRVFLVAIVAVAVIGVWRLIPTLPAVTRAGGALAYGLSPFLLTRIGTGQTMVAAAAAVTPWVLPVLARPFDDEAATVRRAAALGLTGVVGGVAAGALALASGIGGIGRAGAASRPGRRAARLAVLVVVGQLPWLVPSAIALSWPVDLAGASAFEPDTDATGGALRLLAGHGFWQGPMQVGHDQGVVIPLIGLTLLALAVVGTPALPEWGRVARATGLAALVVSAAPVLPLLSELHEWVVELPGGGAFREPQRYLFLYLVWAIPAAAAGIAMLRNRVAGALREAWLSLLLIGALVLSAPGLWGIGGMLEPVALPEEWRAMRALLHDEPGTVVGLPFYEYLDLTLAEGRRVLYPVPEFVGGDVIVSSDPELGTTVHRERHDPRETPVRTLLEEAATSGRIADALAGMGVRWVVLLKNADWQDEDEVLRGDPGAAVRLDGPQLTVFSMTAWRADSNEIETVLAPLARVESGDPERWFRPGGDGWLRGLRPLATDADGNATVPSGGAAVLWYWPALLVLAGDAVTMGAVVFCARRARIS